MFIFILLVFTYLQEWFIIEYVGKTAVPLPYPVDGSSSEVALV